MGIKDYCKLEDGEHPELILLTIPINTLFKGVYIINITTCAELQEDNACGDLSVNWQDEGISEENADDIMFRFYEDEMFLPEIKAKLLEIGFSEDAANSVMPSESGMQDTGRASYDHDLYDEIRAAWNA